MNCSSWLHGIKMEGKGFMKFLSLERSFVVKSSLRFNGGVTPCVLKVTSVAHPCPGFFIHYKFIYTYTCTHMHATLPYTEKENGH